MFYRLLPIYTSYTGLSLGLFLMLLLSWQACSPPSPSIPLETSIDGYKNHAQGVKYLGRDSCGTCHKLQYDSFTDSEMGRSFKRASKSNSIAKWQDIQPIYDRDHDLYYLPFARSKDLYILEFRLTNGDTSHQRLEKIDFIVGSGQHTNSHIREENGFFYQMPLTWYAQDQKWDLPPGFEGGANSRFDRKIEAECMSCHNGIADHVAGSGNRYLSVPEGIGCERCHGPGEIHVKEKKAGKIVNIVEDIDYSIVNPGKLPADLQMDLCQRCHLQGTAVPVYGKDFYDFRPGQRLNQTVDVFLPRSADSLQSFIMASQADRLRMSECFISSKNQDGALTCISCHDPHKAIHSLGERHYIQSCLNCHQDEEQKTCTKAGPEENCMACHMPNSGSIDVPHVRITDHFIRIPDTKRNAGTNSTEINSYLRLECRTRSNPGPLLLARGYLTHYEQFDPLPHFLDSAFAALQRAKQAGMSQLPEWKEAWIRGLYVKEDFERLVTFADSQPKEINYLNPWTYARIGEAHKQVGNIKQAITYYELASNRATDRIDFKNKLGGLLVSQNLLPKAMQILNELITMAPSNATAYNNRGFAYVLNDEMKNAEKDFLKANSLDPDSEKALANLTSLYLSLNQKRQALEYARRLLKLFPKNQGYKKLYELASE